MAAPLLTRAQFLKTPAAKKPGASYGGYVNYVTKARTSRAATRASDPMAGFGQSLGQAPTLAAGDVDAQITALLAGSRAATVTGQQQAQQQATRAQGFAKALADLTTPDAEATGAIYRQAADRLKGFGTGLTGAVADAQQAQAADTARGVATATGTQSRAGGLGVLSGYDPAAMRNVANYAGVTIPGSSLEQSAADAMVHAQAMRKADVAQTGQIAQGYLQKVTDLQNELAAKRMEIEGKRPDLYRQALTAREESARQDLTSRIQAASLQNSTRQMNAEITGVDPLTGKPTYATIQDQREAALEARKFAAQQAQLAAEQAQTTAEKSAPSVQWSQANGYLSDGSGRPILRNGQVQTLPGYELRNGRVIESPDPSDLASAIGPDTSLSTALGYLVDSNGSPIRNKAGKPVILPGFHVDTRTGRVVKDATGSPAGPKPPTSKDMATIGGSVHDMFYGVKNPNYDPNAKTDDPKYLQKRSQWLTPPGEASDILRRLMARGLPYEPIYKALSRYAGLPGTRWNYVLDWQKKGRVR